jgi:hypothetical protein
MRPDIFKNVAVRNLILVFICHLIVVSVSLAPGIRGIPLRESLLQSDQSTYINNATSLVTVGAFTREESAPYLWEPYRTPGLPLIIALSMLLTGSIIPVLFVNCIFAGIAAYCGTKLLQLYTNNRLTLLCYGCLMALLPNALGSDCYILTDALLSYLGIIWIYLLIRAIYSGQFKYAIYSSLCLGYAQLTKPTLSVAVVLIIAIYCIIYWNKWKQLHFPMLITLVFLSLVTPVYLSLKMYQSHGIFTTSLLGEQTKREYLVVNYLAAQTGQSYDTIQAQIRSEDKAAVLARNKWTTKSYYGDLYAYKKYKNDSLISQDYAGFLKVYTIEAIKQVFAPQEILLAVFVPNIEDWMRITGAIINLILLICIAIGIYILYKRKVHTPILILLLFYSFYVAAGSLSTRRGGRLKLPADVISLQIAAIGLSSLLAFKKRDEADIPVPTETPPDHPK